MSTESGPGPDERNDYELVASEERLAMSLPVRVRGRVRFRRRVVTEEVTKTFRLRREELVVQEEPASDEPVSADTRLTEDEFTLVLRAEQLEVTTRVVPVERVRVRTRVVTEDVAVSADLRREQVEVREDTH